MIPLSEVDIDRVKRVRSGELWDRGCGKTIERMVTLFSYLRPMYDDRQYLYVGENGWHTKDIFHTFVSWVQSSGISCDYRPNRLTLIAEFNVWAKPMYSSAFMDKIMTMLEEPKKVVRIKFDFTTPARLTPWGIRGRPYDKIILDLNNETYYRNSRILDEIKYMEKI